MTTDRPKVSFIMKELWFGTTLVRMLLSVAVMVLFALVRGRLLAADSADFLCGMAVGFVLWRRFDDN
jgi:hypothetical protein